MSPCIDIGVNFHSSQLAPHRESLLQRARDAGLIAILATGTSLESSRKAVELAQAQRGFVHATAGVHPHGAKTWSAPVRDELRRLWRLDDVVAVGECGLDFDRNFSTPAEQRIAFEAQLEEAITVGKPLFLHCRDAFAELRSMLRPAVAASARGVVHCFTGNAAEAEAFLDLGLDLGITGWVTDVSRGQDLRAAVARVPLDRLHLETDAPYLGPKNMPRRRPYNEPANLPWVAQAVAELKGVPVDEVERQCAENSRRLFGLGGGTASGGR